MNSVNMTGQSVCVTCNIICCLCIPVQHKSQKTSVEWTLKYDEPEVENVARGRSPSATFSTEGHHICLRSPVQTVGGEMCAAIT